MERKEEGEKGSDLDIVPNPWKERKKEKKKRYFLPFQLLRDLG